MVCRHDLFFRASIVNHMPVTDKRAYSRARAITKTERLVCSDCEDNSWDNETSVPKGRLGENHGELTSYDAF